MSQQIKSRKIFCLTPCNGQTQQQMLSICGSHTIQIVIQIMQVGHQTPLELLSILFSLHSLSAGINWIEFYRWFLSVISFLIWWQSINNPSFGWFIVIRRGFFIFVSEWKACNLIWISIVKQKGVGVKTNKIFDFIYFSKLTRMTYIHVGSRSRNSRWRYSTAHPSWNYSRARK